MKKLPDKTMLKFNDWYGQCVGMSVIGSINGSKTFDMFQWWEEDNSELAFSSIDDEEIIWLNINDIENIDVDWRIDDVIIHMKKLEVMLYLC